MYSVYVHIHLVCFFLSAGILLSTAVKSTINTTPTTAVLLLYISAIEIIIQSTPGGGGTT